MIDGLVLFELLGCGVGHFIALVDDYLVAILFLPRDNTYWRSLAITVTPGFYVASASANLVSCFV